MKAGLGCKKRGGSMVLAFEGVALILFVLFCLFLCCFIYCIFVY